MFNQKIKIALAIGIMIAIVLALNVISYAGEKITEDCNIGSSAKVGSKITFGVYYDPDDYSKVITIDGDKFNFPAILYNYHDEIILRVTYDSETLEVFDCKVVNKSTGEVVNDLSEDNINKLFNVEYGKTANDKNWTDVIKLSELKEDTLYKYTATQTSNIPKIENDTDKNYIVYRKRYDTMSDSYTQYIYMSKNIESSAISYESNEFKEGDSFYLIFRQISNESLLYREGEKKFIRLSKYSEGDKLEYSFDTEYVYNDTDKDITLIVQDSAFGVGSEENVVVEKGKIYGFSWMINQVTVGGSGTGNTQQSTNASGTQNNNQKTNTQNTNTQKNNTSTVSNKPNPAPTGSVKNTTNTATSNIPATGVNDTVIISVIIVTAIALGISIRIIRLKDVK